MRKPETGLSNTLTSLGAAAGTVLGRGNPIATTIGGLVGTGAGKFIDWIRGRGDYTITNNTLLTQGSTVGRDGLAMAPKFLSTASGLEISHREFVADIGGSTGFQISSFDINPGLNNIFPWLAKVANNFEQYEMLGLILEYRPSSGTIAAASPALGVICYATDYNVYRPPFASKREVDAYEFATSCVPNVGMIHPVECMPKENPVSVRYIRDAPAPGDQRMYDLGKFQVATQGMQSAYTCGELWVSYHVRLLKPRIPTPVPLLPPIFCGSTVNDSVTPGNLMGASYPTNWVVRQNGFDASKLAVNYDFSQASVWLYKRGQYVIQYLGVEGTDCVFTTTFGPGANIVASADYNQAYNRYNYTSAGPMGSQLFTVNADGITIANRVTIGGGNNWTSGTGTITVFQVSDVTT